MNQKVIIVGSKEIHDWFTESWQDWDTQTPTVDVAAMWSNLQNGDLSDASEIVIFDEHLFDENNPHADFAEAVATFAPEALVIVTSYDETTQVVISNAVAQMRQQYGLAEGPIYFLNVTAENFDPDADMNAIVSARQDYVRARDNERKNLPPEQVKPEVPVNTQPAPFNDPQPAPEPAAPTKRGLIIASTSSKGGSGKTTVAMCTASMFYHSSRLATEQGLRDKPLSVCIVDMDTRDGQIGFLLGKTSPSALNVYLSPDKSVKAIRELLVYDEKLGIHALLAPKRARTAEYLTPEFYRDVIEKLATMFDVVVLDTSVNYLDPLLGQLVLPIADAILFVTNLSIGSVYGMTRWMDEVTASVEDGGSGIPQSKIGIVVNQSLPGVGIDQELLQQAASGAILLVAIPLDSQAVIAASNYNSLSDIVLKHPDISPSYYSLVEKLMREAPLASPMTVLAQQPQPQRKPEQHSSNKPQTGVEAMPVSKKRSNLFGFGRKK
jgi:MinD-like ATPase involved in chromosome partitioning or flagellar assembly